jgi:hypothetical protein
MNQVIMWKVVTEFGSVRVDDYVAADNMEISPNGIVTFTTETKLVKVFGISRWVSVEATDRPVSK